MDGWEKAAPHGTLHMVRALGIMLMLMLMLMGWEGREGC